MPPTAPDAITPNASTSSPAAPPAITAAGSGSTPAAPGATTPAAVTLGVPIAQEIQLTVSVTSVTAGNIYAQLKYYGNITIDKTIAVTNGMSAGAVAAAIRAAFNADPEFSYYFEAVGSGAVWLVRMKTSGAGYDEIGPNDDSLELFLDHGTAGGIADVNQPIYTVMGVAGLSTPTAITAPGSGTTPAAPGAITSPGSGSAPTAPAAITSPGSGSAPTAPAAITDVGTVGTPAVLIISGVSTSGVNGNLYPAGTVNGTAAYSRDGSLVTGPANVIVNWNGTSSWFMVMGSTYSASKASAAATPEGLAGWTVALGTGSPVITAVAPGAITPTASTSTPSAPAAIAP